MPPPKAAGRALLNYASLLNSGLSYAAFLQRTASQSKAYALLKTTKAEIDAEFAAQVRKRYPNDYNRGQRLVAEAATEASNELWKSLRSAAIERNPNLRFVGVTHEVVKSIRLATLYGTLPNGSSAKDALTRQTYEAFASNTESLNEQTEFDKDLMDAAFRRATEKTVSKKRVATYKSVDVDRMLHRCLGKESNEYWKDRG